MSLEDSLQVIPIYGVKYIYPIIMEYVQYTGLNQ